MSESDQGILEEVDLDCTSILSIIHSAWRKLRSECESLGIRKDVLPGGGLGL